MTYGIKCTNNNGIVSVDEDAWTYVYIGKWQIMGAGDHYVHCVGYPLIFFGVPHNTINAGEGQNGNFYDLRKQAGLAVRRIRSAGSGTDTWIVTISCNLDNAYSLGLYIRVFGLLHANYPGGSGEEYGGRLWNAQGQLSFDTGFRQLRLAGNTYDTELQITSQVAGEASGNASTGSSVVGVPFDLANKSIMANTRGTILYPYTTGAYHDNETGQDVFLIVWMYIDTLFWTSGNSLYARKSTIQEFSTDSTSNPSVVTTGNTIYTRVAIIDNNLYP